MSELQNLGAVGAMLTGVGGAITLFGGGGTIGTGLIAFGLTIWGLCTVATSFVNAKN